MVTVDIVEKSVLIVGREYLVAVADAIEEVVDTINVDLCGVGEGTHREDQFLLEAGWSFSGEAAVRWRVRLRKTRRTPSKFA